MFRSMSINNCSSDKSRFWQGFPSENRLKSHREKAACPSSKFDKAQHLMQGSVPHPPRPLAASCKRLHRMRPSSEFGGYLHECGGASDTALASSRHNPEWAGTTRTPQVEAAHLLGTLGV